MAEGSFVAVENARQMRRGFEEAAPRTPLVGHSLSRSSVDAVLSEEFIHRARLPQDAPANCRKNLVALPRFGEEEQDPLAREMWVADLWKKLDRDRSGTITKRELDCELFHEIIRAAVNPDRAATGGGSHTRAELNMKDGINFCLRKADQNSDASLTFEEFRSLLLCLTDPACGRADLAFALFDLDNSGQIDVQEFRSLCRFFLGRNATQDEFFAEWKRITKGNDLNIEVMQQTATRNQYVRWLQTTPTAAFNQYAPPRAAQAPATGAGGGLNVTLRGSVAERPRWNNKLNTGPNPGHVNDALPLGRRAYFSRAQSTPQLKEFYDSFGESGVFKNHRREIDKPPHPRAIAALLPKSLSSEGGTPLTLPGRHGPDGTMRDHKTGRPAIWEDNFIAPLRFRMRDRPGDLPLAPRATFGELTDSYGSMRSSGKSSSRSTSSPGGRLRRTGRPPNPDDCHDIRPSRVTTLEAVPH